MATVFTDLSGGQEIIVAYREEGVELYVWNADNDVCNSAYMTLGEWDTLVAAVEKARRENV